MCLSLFVCLFVCLSVCLSLSVPLPSAQGQRALPARARGGARASRAARGPPAAGGDVSAAMAPTGPRGNGRERRGRGGTGGGGRAGARGRRARAPFAGWRCPRLGAGGSVTYAPRVTFAGAACGVSVSGVREGGSEGVSERAFWRWPFGVEHLHPDREGSGGTARVPAPTRPATQLCRENKNWSLVGGTGCAPAARGSESKVPFHGLNRSRGTGRTSKITAPNWRCYFKLDWSIGGCLQWCCCQQSSQALPF